MRVSDWRGSGRPTATPTDIDGKRGVDFDRLLDPRRGATELAAVQSDRGAPKRRLIGGGDGGVPPGFNDQRPDPGARVHVRC